MAQVSDYATRLLRLCRYEVGLCGLADNFARTTKRSCVLRDFTIIELQKNNTPMINRGAVEGIRNLFKTLYYLRRRRAATPARPRSAIALGAGTGNSTPLYCQLVCIPSTVLLPKIFTIP